MLAGSLPEDDAATRVDQWATANDDAVSRAMAGLRGIQRLETSNIAALSVALRTLRAVVRAGTA